MGQSQKVIIVEKKALKSKVEANSITPKESQKSQEETS